MSLKVGGTMQSFLTAVKDGLDAKVARGAVRAGATVIKDRAAELCISEEVRDSLTVTTPKADPGTAVAKIQTTGPGAYIAPWVEHGTDPHLVRVNDEERAGRTVGRINRQAREGSLVIGGHFVGPVVHHPGATAHPFMRPAVDQATDAAVKAMGEYIADHLTPAGLAAPAEPTDPDE